MSKTLETVIIYKAHSNNSANTLSNQIPPVALPAADVPAEEFSTLSYHLQTEQYQTCPATKTYRLNINIHDKKLAVISPQTSISSYEENLMKINVHNMKSHLSLIHI